MAFRIKLPKLYRGAAYKKSLLWNYKDENGNKFPNDLTGFNGRIQLRDDSGSEVYAEWSTANGKLIFLGNKISIHVHRPETESYTCESAKWDLLIWPLDLIDEAEVLMFGEIDTPLTITDLP